MAQICARLLPLFLLFLLYSVSLATPWVVAHRGGAALGPENTLETFEKAVVLGVDAIELDIHQSRDGHLMVIHDNTLNRTYQRDGRVDQMNLSQLQAVGVPTLEQAIEQVAGRCRLVVEIKHPKGERHRGIERRLVKLLKSKGLLETSIVISFDQITLRRLHQLEPKLHTGLLFALPIPSVEKAKKELGIRYLGPHYLLASEKLLAEAHRLGLKVNPWTVNEVLVMRTLRDLGCDAITTDHPDKLLQELEATPVLKR